MGSLRCARRGRGSGFASARSARWRQRRARLGGDGRGRIVDLRIGPRRIARRRIAPGRLGFRLLGGRWAGDRRAREEPAAHPPARLIAPHVSAEHLGGGRPRREPGVGAAGSHRAGSRCGRGRCPSRRRGSQHVGQAEEDQEEGRDEGSRRDGGTAKGRRPPRPTRVDLAVRLVAPLGDLVARKHILARDLVSLVPVMFPFESQHGDESRQGMCQWGAKRSWPIERPVLAPAGREQGRTTGAGGEFLPSWVARRWHAGCDRRTPQEVGPCE